MSSQTSAFREAIAAIDRGDLETLRRLLGEDPALVQERLDDTTDAYFAHPYLLWFVAGNPVRNETLPANIAEAAGAIIEAGATREQIDYTLELVASGRVARESGVQLELIDLLLSHGASTDGAMLAALAHHETAAAERLLERGAKLTLVPAVCLRRDGEAHQLAETATASERQIALTAAAFYGHPDHVRMLIAAGVDVRAYSPKGFHPHATPLHQAVYAGSLESVKALVEAGADHCATDRVYHSTPLGWAEYGQKPEIAEYLRGLGTC